MDSFMIDYTKLEEERRSFFSILWRDFGNEILGVVIALASFTAGLFFGRILG